MSARCPAIISRSVCVFSKSTDACALASANSAFISFRTPFRSSFVANAFRSLRRDCWQNLLNLRESEIEVSEYVFHLGGSHVAFPQHSEERRDAASYHRLAEAIAVPMDWCPTATLPGEVGVQFR